MALEARRAVVWAVHRCGGMSPLAFGIKRMFLRSNAIHFGFAKIHRLTPARVDMLTAIAKGKHGMVQYFCRSMLGVRSPTVSRMMRSLEKLGYITRRKYPPDRRHRWVTLTDLGREVVRCVEQDFTAGFVGEQLARQLVSRQPYQREPTEKALADARTMVRTVRALSGDHAWLCYPSYDGSGVRLPGSELPYGDDPSPWPEWRDPPPP